MGALAGSDGSDGSADWNAHITGCHRRYRALSSEQIRQSRAVKQLPASGT